MVSGHGLPVYIIVSHMIVVCMIIFWIIITPHNGRKAFIILHAAIIHTAPWHNVFKSFTCMTLYTYTLVGDHSECWWCWCKYSSFLPGQSTAWKYLSNPSWTQKVSRSFSDSLQWCCVHWERLAEHSGHAAECEGWRSIQSWQVWLWIQLSLSYYRCVCNVR